MPDRIAELRALVSTGFLLTRMEVDALLACAEYLQKLIDQEHRTVPSHVRQELIRDALGSLARLNGKTT